MSEKLGQMTFEPERRPLFLEIAPFSGTKDYSEATAREIDGEVRRIIDDCYQKVKALLTEKKMLLEKVARILLEKETIEGDDLRVLIRGHEGENE